MSGSEGNREQKRRTGEEIWLQYYNQALFERGLINEEERNRMANRIRSRGARAGGMNCHGPSR